MNCTAASAVGEDAAAMITPESGWFRRRGSTDGTGVRAIRYTGTNRDQVHAFLGVPMAYHPEVSGLVLPGVSVKPGSWVLATPIGPQIHGHAEFDAAYERVARWS